ncbi:hypothetical protein [Oricola thermophila]|uniref:Uncharacterized protein n=1 Tax=Oricola thermophila TaxID=2742145 RepID=A0A6N1VAH3_9HYPH|nr:hypothetical protein [Oricola thermophila]QKV17688.1 hypothetical protein HTY61_03990 [Oricola thermophila]
MKTHNFLATWTGMLNVAARRDAPTGKATAKAPAGRGKVARLLRRA